MQLYRIKKLLEFDIQGLKDRNKIAWGKALECSEHELTNERLG